MSSPTVSIIMPAYNVQQYIGLAIESVLAQRFVDWELVIVNDGSKDNTRDVIARYTDARITCIDQQNGGEAAARNTALDHLQGDYIAFLDADDFYRNDRSKTMLSRCGIRITCILLVLAVRVIRCFMPGLNHF